MIWLLVLLLPFAVVGLGLVLRPWYLFRGLTAEDRQRNWPGDDAIAGAKPSGSRAITINAPAHQVWPWLTQIGQDRAGFYSYRWLENLFGAQMPDYSALVPCWSERHPGQKLRMAPEKRFGPIAAMDIVAVERHHFIVAKNFEGTWSFIVEPVNDARCRLIARGTWVPSKNVFGRLAHAALFDPVHYIMEWKMVRSIKQLAESRYLVRCSASHRF